MPAPQATPASRDWRDTYRAATDIALLGILTTFAALPLVTAGAAAVTASRAVHHWCDYSELPALRTAGRWFRRALLPGLAGLLAVSTVAGALAADAVLIGAGRVPGGTTALGLTLVVSWLLVGIAAIALVRVGQRPDRPWQALGAAVPATVRGWIAVTAAGGVVGFAGVLGTLLPMTIPLLPGVVLLALHALVRRLLPALTEPAGHASARANGRRFPGRKRQRDFPMDDIVAGQATETRPDVNANINAGTRRSPLTAHSSEDY